MRLAATYGDVLRALVVPCNITTIHSSAAGPVWAAQGVMLRCPHCRHVVVMLRVAQRLRVLRGNLPQGCETLGKQQARHSRATQRSTTTPPLSYITQPPPSPNTCRKWQGNAQSAAVRSSSRAREPRVGRINGRSDGRPERRRTDGRSEAICSEQ